MAKSVAIAGLVLVTVLTCAGCSSNNPESDGKVLKPDNPYSVACHAVRVVLKNDMPAVAAALETKYPGLDAQKKLFKVMDFLLTANPQKIVWKGVSGMEMDREEDKEQGKGLKGKEDLGDLKCFHGSFSYTGPLGAGGYGAGKWRYANGAQGKVLSCVSKTGTGKEYGVETVKIMVAVE